MAVKISLAPQNLEMDKVLPKIPLKIGWIVQRGCPNLDGPLYPHS